MPLALSDTRLPADHLLSRHRILTVVYGSIVSCHKESVMVPKHHTILQHLNKCLQRQPSNLHLCIDWSSPGLSVLLFVDVSRNGE